MQNLLLRKIEENAHNAPRTDASASEHAIYAAETADLLLQLAREVEALQPTGGQE